MLPVLLKIGPVPIHTYGLMIALGFILGMSLARYLAKREGVDPDRISDFSFWMLVSGLLGGRLLFVITRWEYFSQDPMAIFRIWEGGLVFLGGLVFTLPVGAYYARKHKLPPWKVFDIAMPGVALAHALGRLGCVAAGCCYGKPTGGDWGLRLNSELVDIGLRGIPLHPTQLYEAFSLGALVLGLVYISRIKKFDGQVGITYLLTYPVIRSIIEEFRGDLIRGFVIEDVLSTSQFISALVFCGALVLYFYRSKQVRAA